MKRLSILLILVLAASIPAWSESPVGERTQPVDAAPAAPAAPNYNLDWYSINSGGAVDATSTSYRFGASVGQAAAGEATGTSYKLGLGFWYGLAVVGVSCPIALDGDVDTSGSVTSADIIYLVNFVFKGGPTPLPCEAAGDVECSGSVTSADIIYLVNYVFKGADPPCDICNLSSMPCP